MTANPVQPQPPRPAFSAPRLYRNSSGRLVGGVAGAVADHLGVRRGVVRLAFVLLSFSAGMGVLLYGAFWITLPTPPEAPPKRPVRSAAEYLAALVGGAVVLLFNARTLPLGWWFFPSVLACFGGALLWRQASETDRERWRRLSRSSLSAGAFDRAGWLRIVAGVALVIGGALLILAQAGLSAVGAGFTAMLVTVIGVGLITGPWWLRLVQQLSEERRERIRNEERADLAANLHDSVLQTLALIQRSAHQPREVARLARSQERELRSKLYGSNTKTGLFGAELQRMAAEVEDSYAITVDVVVVGEHPLDPGLDAVIGAAREALVNVAKHAQVTEVSVYAEFDEARLVVFVRDRGVGFDPAQTDASRQGIRGSIVGRLERQRGRASVKSSPGEGTEVRLEMAVTP